MDEDISLRSWRWLYRSRVPHPVGKSIWRLVVNWFMQDVLLSCGHLNRATWPAVMTVGKTLFCRICNENRKVEEVEILSVSTASSVPDFT
jgi:hypothetical protein